MEIVTLEKLIQKLAKDRRFAHEVERFCYGSDIYHLLRIGLTELNMGISHEELKALFERDPGLHDAREKAWKIYCETWHGKKRLIPSTIKIEKGDIYAQPTCPYCSRPVKEVKLKIKQDEVLAVIRDYKILEALVKLHLKGASEEEIRAYIIANRLKP